MGTNLSMSYSEMEETAKRVKAMAEDLRRLMSDMTRDVNALCDNWTAEASPIFREDYTKLANNVENTSEVVDELTLTVEQYASDMQALDQSYAKSKVSAR